MTCVVGIVEDGVVYLGADSSSNIDGFCIKRKDSKVFRNGEFIFGFSGSWRMGQLLEHNFSLELPDGLNDNNIMRFMVLAFIPKLKNCFKEADFMTTEDGRAIGGNFLVGVRGRLFAVDYDFNVGEDLDSFTACGSGKIVALSSLTSTHGMSGAVERLEVALLCAEKYVHTVAKPFNFIDSSAEKAYKTS